MSAILKISISEDKRRNSSQKERQEMFIWSDDEVDLLLKVTNEHKASAL